MAKRNGKTKSKAGKAAEQKLVAQALGTAPKHHMVSLPEQYVAQLIKYLQKRPYEEVAALLSTMHQLTQPQRESES